MCSSVEMFCTSASFCAWYCYLKHGYALFLKHKTFSILCNIRNKKKQLCDKFGRKMRNKQLELPLHNTQIYVCTSESRSEFSRGQFSKKSLQLITLKVYLAALVLEQITRNVKIPMHCFQSSAIMEGNQTTGSKLNWSDAKCFLR